jgi:hypothetical protein
MHRPFVALLAFPLLLAGGAHAQTPAWRNTAELYFQGAGLSGSTAIGPLAVNVDASFSQILENLQFGAMVAYRGESPTVAVTADVMFFGLGAAGDGPVGFVAGKVDVDEWLVTATAGLRVTKELDLFLGARITALTDTLVLTPVAGTARTAEMSQTWVDPIIGLRAKVPVGKGWSVEAYGDLGGLGVGSDFTWMLQGRVGFQISTSVGAAIGYRALYQDYETGSGADYFKWDITGEGPVAAINISF